jgi:hypothetical protein
MHTSRNYRPSLLHWSLQTRTLTLDTIPSVPPLLRPNQLHLHPQVRSNQLIFLMSQIGALLPSYKPTSVLNSRVAGLHADVRPWNHLNLFHRLFKVSLFTRSNLKGALLGTETMIFHRDSVAREILSTEQTYVQNLKIVLGVRPSN